MLTVWDKKIFSCEFVVKDENFVALIGRWGIVEGLMGFVNVYGPQDQSDRKKVWEKLDLLCDKEEIKWVFFGDFKEVRCTYERLNSVTCNRGTKEFNDFIRRNKLEDVRLCGNRFTRVSDDGIKHNKLDRFLISSLARTEWKDLRFRVLERKWSDHFSIVLTDKRLDFGPIPFKFYDAWLLDRSIEEVVKEAWGKEV